MRHWVNVMNFIQTSLIPAKAGIQWKVKWIPAFAGMGGNIFLKKKEQILRNSHGTNI